MGYKNLERTGEAGAWMAHFKRTAWWPALHMPRQALSGRKPVGLAIDPAIHWNDAYPPYKTDCGIIVTTARFRDPAVTLAREHEVALIIGDRLMTMLETTQWRRF
jgi:hypothetical protein